MSSVSDASTIRNVDLCETFGIVAGVSCGYVKINDGNIAGTLRAGERVLSVLKFFASRLKDILDDCKNGRGAFNNLRI